jgi:HSP20 family protein
VPDTARTAEHGGKEINLFHEGGTIMFGSRWTPFNNPMWGQLQQLHNEVNRLVERWGEGSRHVFGTVEYPPVNLWEDDDVFVLEAELPGLDLKDLEMYVTGHDQLTLKGERKVPKPEKGVQHRQERGFGSFARTITLPMDVDATKVEARLDNGVLSVRLPKSEAAKPHKIEVKG